MVHALMPLAVLTMLVGDGEHRPQPAARRGSRSARGRARRSGAIYFPLSFPGVAAGAIMVFVTAIGFFIVPALLGGRTRNR